MDFTLSGREVRMMRTSIVNNPQSLFSGRAVVGATLLVALLLVTPSGISSVQASTGIAVKEVTALEDFY